MAAILVQNLIDLHIRLPGREIGAPLEADAIEPAGGEEDAVIQHAAQFEIGLELVLI